MRIDKGKKKKSFKPFLLTLAVIFFVILAIIFIRFLWNGKWDSVRRFTLVFNSKPLILFSIEPKTGQSVLMTIPDNTYVEVPFDYGKYAVSSVFRLGELEQKKNGGELMEKTIEQSLGLFVDGYFSYTSQDPFIISLSDDEFSDFKKKYFTLSQLPRVLFYLLLNNKNFDTNLSQIDLLRLWIKIKDIRIDKITYLDLKVKGILEELKLPDGTDVYEIDTDALDVVIADHFEDFSIRTESMSWKIVNAAGYSNLATNMGRLMNTLGANVLVKETASEIEKNRCRIELKISKLKKSNMVDRIWDKYRCQITENKDLAEVDAQLILGEEFIQ